MISFEDALSIVMASDRSVGTEKIPFTRALGRVIASDALSDIDMPSFDKSSMDGFAVRKADMHLDLEVIETIPAGKSPKKKIGKGQCSRIMTGAMVPEGADRVVMVEDTETLSTGLIRIKNPFSKDNISFRGEDVKKGDIVLRQGRMIKPEDIAVLASTGNTSVVVSRMPEMGVISTGSELIEPNAIPAGSQVRDSNSYQLMAQIERAGASGKYYGIVKDDEEETLSVVRKAIDENDIVILTGGVSMGDFDFVPSVFRKAGVKIQFDRIAVQPGKPTTFGIHPDAFVFGLPGNPVSSFMQFELLVRPLIYKMMGFNWNPLPIKLPLREKYIRRSSERMGLIPVAITEDNMVVPVEFHGSAHISAIPFADGIIMIPAGKDTLEKGEFVSVRPL
ncbi:MAG TPA: molybdopterin molybdotransferase MoeA [Bacteroidales bacterium]|jgi:molybdopterin molybdotransferase|nr:molybdopterin molybdenumtransferase MoeA [Bacteroidales bacterium]OQB60247.1 MAG: Molybdopterin molybdenumtransferase [Bacteroidetes bacterium ADurb.Bin145]HOU01866.1 molybdopterin molybdotransferase MoeA [Bacteroidales bacterium]HQG63935.1 molybdopterin molybdotransferase MoeA [Bacteroidales bacterium]HQK69025.1 molybdopterin molybdotransferase MoeA [Bacteroidales bacterium]